MKSTRLSLLACALIGAFGAVSLPVAANDDAAKLEALQRALGSAGVPGTEGQDAPKKKRTRAIVFDNEPAAAAQGAPAAPAAAVQAVAAPANCTSLNPETPGTAVDFAIQFNAGSAVVAPASAPLLDQIGKVLSMNPNGCIVVEGHTDVSGNADKNTALSKQRAESVVQYLGKSITPTRMVPVGKGSSQLLPGVAPTDPKHRRVVFKIVS
jgi:outer membrane protein OmpA-like peptidoglycan-associated protein